jgi:HK97 family phage major capsid protein
MDEIRKGMTERAVTSSAAGAVLVQTVTDQIVANLVEYNNPLRMNLPRRPGSGQAWLLNRRSAPGTTPAQWIADTAEPEEDNGTYARVSFTYRTLIARGKITRQVQATGRDYLDIMTEEMEQRAEDFRNQEDKALLVGNNTANTAQPDGLCVLIPVGQCVITTTADGGEKMTLLDIDTTIDTCTGDPDAIIVSKRSRREIQALLQANQRHVNVVEVNGGFQLLSYNGIPVYVSSNLLDTKMFNGAITTQETGGDNSELYVVDFDHTWVGELTPVTMAPLAMTSSQFDQFDIYEDVVLVVRNNQANAKLIGIDPTIAAS